MSENINEYKSKLEEFCNTRDKLFTLLQNEENIEKRIHLQELIIKAEENIKNYQLLHVNSFSNDNNKNNNNKINENELSDSYIFIDFSFFVFNGDFQKLKGLDYPLYRC